MDAVEYIKQARIFCKLNNSSYGCIGCALYGRCAFKLDEELTDEMIKESVKFTEQWAKTIRRRHGAHESINEPEEENMQTWKIMIVSTGDKTTAKLYVLGRVIREVSVTRYYKDEYSTEVAVKEAMRKLFKPQGFTGKAMFVGNPGLYSDGFTYGKIYEFKNGFCVDNNDDKRPATGYPTTLEIGNWGSGDFIKVVE